MRVYLYVFAALYSDRDWLSALHTSHNHVYRVHFSMHTIHIVYLILLRIPFERDWDWREVPSVCKCMCSRLCVLVSIEHLLVVYDVNNKIISNRIIIAYLKGYDCRLLIQLFISATPLSQLSIMGFKFSFS